MYKVQTTRSLRFPKPPVHCFSLSPGKIFRILSEGGPGGAGWTAVYGGECGPGSMVENSVETVAREVHEGQERVIEEVLVWWRAVCGGDCSPGGPACSEEDGGPGGP